MTNDIIVQIYYSFRHNDLLKRQVTMKNQDNVNFVSEHTSVMFHK